MMSQYMENLGRPVKAEPSSPSFNLEDNWLFNDNLDSNDGIFASLPLSLIQEDRKSFLDENSQFNDLYDHLSDSNSSQYPLSPQDAKFGPIEDSLKYEESISSPPYSPQLSGNSSPNEKTQRAQIASKLLNDLDEGFKTEPYNNWLEEKIDLPIFEEIPAQREAPNTESLLLEFEYVCDTFANQSANLTPPQSPPGAHISSPTLYHNEVPYNAWPNTTYHLEPIIHSDIEKDLAFVDDLVSNATRNITWEEKVSHIIPNFIPTPIADNKYPICPTESIVDAVDVDSYESSPAVVDHTYISPISESSSSSPYSPSSSSSSVYGSSENDDEWSNSPKNKRAKIARTKPYTRFTEEKQSRKKEQNKNAATRYRQKKKAEIEVLMDEEKVLRLKNEELSIKHVDICREVLYLKTLMRDLCRAQGLIK